MQKALYNKLTIFSTKMYYWFVKCKDIFSMTNIQMIVLYMY